MTYVFNTAIFILMSMMGVACVVKANDAALRDRQSIDSSHFVEELELQSRISLAGSLELRNQQSQDFEATGIVVTVLRGRIKTSKQNRYVYVLAQRQGWFVSGEDYFWVRMKEKDFLKRNLRVDESITVTQSKKHSPQLNYRDYDLFYKPASVVAVK